MVFVTNNPSPQTGVNKDAHVYRESPQILNIVNSDGEELSLIGQEDRLDSLQTELGDILRGAFTTLQPTPKGPTMTTNDVQAIRARIEAEIIANRTHATGETHDCSHCEKIDCEKNRLPLPEPLVTSNTTYRAHDDNMLPLPEPLCNAEAPSTHEDGPHFRMKPRVAGKPETPEEKKASDWAPGSMHGGPIPKAKSSGDQTDNEDEEDLNLLPPDERVARLWGRAETR